MRKTKKKKNDSKNKILWARFASPKILALACLRYDAMDGRTAMLAHIPTTSRPLKRTRSNPQEIARTRGIAVLAKVPTENHRTTCEDTLRREHANGMEHVIATVSHKNSAQTCCKKGHGSGAACCVMPHMANAKNASRWRACVYPKSSGTVSSKLRAAI